MFEHKQHHYLPQIHTMEIQTLISTCLLFALVTITSGQRGRGLSRRQQLQKAAKAESAVGTLLQAAEKDAFAQEALLDSQSKRQAVSGSKLIA